MQIKRQTRNRHSNAQRRERGHSPKGRRCDGGDLKTKHSFGNRHLAAVPLYPTTHWIIEVKAIRRWMVQGDR